MPKMSLSKVIPIKDVRQIIYQYADPLMIDFWSADDDGSKEYSLGFYCEFWLQGVYQSSIMAPTPREALRQFPNVLFGKLQWDELRNMIISLDEKDYWNGF